MPPRDAVPPDPGEHHRSNPRPAIPLTNLGTSNLDPQPMSMRLSPGSVFLDPESDLSLRFESDGASQSDLGKGQRQRIGKQQRARARRAEQLKLQNQAAPPPSASYQPSIWSVFASSFPRSDNRQGFPAEVEGDSDETSSTVVATIEGGTFNDQSQKQFEWHDYSQDTSYCVNGTPTSLARTSSGCLAMETEREPTTVATKRYNTRSHARNHATSINPSVLLCCQQTPPKKKSVSAAKQIVQQIKTKLTKRKSRRLAPEPELEILSSSHHNLTFWKNKYFDELLIKSDYELIQAVALSFRTASIQTVVPDRFFRSQSRLKPNHRRPAFPGEIETLQAGQAVRKAYEEHTPAKQDVGRLVLWTDASGTRGIGIVYRETLPGGAGWSSWTMNGYVARGREVHNTDVEGLAVLKAIDLACEKVRAKPERWTAVSIYTDSLGFLQLVKRNPLRPQSESTIKKAMKLRRLGNNLTITLHWCPGHSRVSPK
ncbi:hypothetical protein K504DRAFT_458986 [Pleomassaria siparia CBS 279.74]|uniref:RNase H type-1 domain-containing protein n=1 Tax=Pleomassaria siparia CBS 279.74 TaxID=1314801 RepID=A0A6G1K1B2_9PLEO|nr:hypothetical protein K504DRAFT_458986 [Pleomassaria siparia CBS 279.74]